MRPSASQLQKKYLSFWFVDRTSTIRWKYVASNFAQVFTCLIYTYFIFVRFCMPAFRTFSKEHMTPRVVLISWFGCMMPGTLVLFVGKSRISNQRFMP